MYSFVRLKTPLDIILFTPTHIFLRDEWPFLVVLTSKESELFLQHYPKLEKQLPSLDLTSSNYKGKRLHWVICTTPSSLNVHYVSVFESTLMLLMIKASLSSSATNGGKCATEDCLFPALLWFSVTVLGFIVACLWRMSSAVERPCSWITRCHERMFMR